MTPGTETTIPAARSAATLRALDSSRRLVELLKDCETAMGHANESVDQEARVIIAQISQCLAAAREQAELLQQRVKQSADDRSGFWEPAHLGRRR